MIFEDMDPIWLRTMWEDGGTARDDMIEILISLALLKIKSSDVVFLKPKISIIKFNHSQWDASRRIWLYRGCRTSRTVGVSLLNLKDEIELN